jgi:hypothetical protein
MMQAVGAESPIAVAADVARGIELALAAPGLAEWLFDRGYWRRADAVAA